jgi:RND family efflux transporter MFP subunit
MRVSRNRRSPDDDADTWIKRLSPNSLDRVAQPLKMGVKTERKTDDPEPVLRRNASHLFQARCDATPHLPATGAKEPLNNGIAEAVLVSTGQTVRKGQALAVFSSQVISEQRSALQTAQKRQSFALTVYEREKKLWEQKITAEQDFLQAQAALREAEIAVENAQQKLNALGVTGGGGSGLNRFELRAPYDGLVVERNLSVGEAVKEDTPIMTISDMSAVWVEVSIPAKDLPLMRVGAKVLVRATAPGMLVTQ